MRDEDDVVVELAVGEFLTPCFSPRLDKLPPSLTGRVTSIDDVGSDLRHVGGVFAYICFNDGDTFADRLEQGHILVIRIFVGLTRTGVIREVVSSEVR